MTAAVFLGPTLPVEAAREVLPADYLPPVRQGDIYRLLRSRRPSAIAVIDGYFHEVPSVWHKEILWALDQGIPVHGAASMGALRAAELDIYGMRGHGRIYQAFRDGAFPPDLEEVFEDDDEVAVIHGPAEMGYPVLSEAMVDIRATLAAAVEAGVIGAAGRRALAAAFKALNYRERRWDMLAQLSATAAIDPTEVEGLQAWLPDGRRAQKRDDALALLDHLGSSSASSQAPPAQPFSFERTTLWAQFVEAAERRAAAEPEALDRLVLDELRLDIDAFAEIRRHAAMRAAALQGRPLSDPSTAEKRQALDRLRQRQGLWTRGDLEAWTESVGLDGHGFERLIEAEAALEASAEEDIVAVETAMLDLLRLDGRFPALAKRARDKADRLADAGVSESTPWNEMVLVDWFFEERLGRPAPADPATLASHLGYESLAAFAVALGREHRYLELCRQDPEAGDPGSGNTP